MELSPLYSPAPPSSTFLSRLFHRSLFDSHDTSLSSPLDRARNLLKPRGQSGDGTELQGRSPAVVEVPYVKGKHRNACVRRTRRNFSLPSRTVLFDTTRQALRLGWIGSDLCNTDGRSNDLIFAYFSTAVITDIYVDSYFTCGYFL